MKKEFQIRTAGFCFFNGQLLLITHKKNNREYWVVPGGRVEFGEKATQALVREFKEELNIKIKVVKFLFYQEVFPPEYPCHSLSLFYLVKPLSKQIRLEKGSILGQYKFFNRNQIKNILLYPKINKLIQTNFKSWLREV